MKRLEQCFPEDIGRQLEECPILVQPLGTIEWHSYHLPIGLDCRVAEALGERVATEAGAVLAPTQPWGVGGVPQPYTVNCDIAVIEPALTAVLSQFAVMGFRVIVVVAGHFSLYQTLMIKRSAVNVMDATGSTVLATTTYDMVAGQWSGDHAAIGETSLLMAIAPEQVHMSAIAPDQPLVGIIGDDPRGVASPEFGRRLLLEASEATAAVATRLLVGTSPTQRVEYLQALRANVAVLESLARERKRIPRADVPAVVTPEYVAMSVAIREGRYGDALKAAETKRRDLRR